MVSSTIAIPFTQLDDYLWLAIESCLHQSMRADVFELICDAELTESDERVLTIFCREMNIEFYYDGESKGLASRLNESISRCRTDLYFRMDADDICDPQRLERQTTYMQQGKYDMCCARADYIDSEGSIIGESKMLSGVMQKNKFTPFSNLIIHPSVVFKTAWAQAHAYDTAMNRSQDKELWLRSYDTGEFFITQEKLIKYRVSSKKNFKKKMENYRWSLVSAKRHWRKFGIKGAWGLLKTSALFVIYRGLCVYKAN